MRCFVPWFSKLESIPLAAPKELVFALPFLFFPVPIYVRWAIHIVDLLVSFPVPEKLAMSLRNNIGKGSQTDEGGLESNGVTQG